jgi:hypothetical protein
MAEDTRMAAFEERMERRRQREAAHAVLEEIPEASTEGESGLHLVQRSSVEVRADCYTPESEM